MKNTLKMILAMLLLTAGVTSTMAEESSKKVGVVSDSNVNCDKIRASTASAGEQESADSQDCKPGEPGCEGSSTGTR